MTFKWLPNALTIARCGLAFVVGWAIVFLPSLWPLVIFAATALTDFVDGHAARKLKAESEVGAWLDPVADKFLVAVSLISVCYVYVWRFTLTIPTILIIARDVAVTVLRLFPNIKLPVVRLAKWKTALEMLGIAAIILALYYLTDSGPLFWGGLTLIWLAALLSAYTGIRYASSALSQMQNDRA